MEQHEIRKRLKKELDKGRYEHTKGVMLSLIHILFSIADANEFRFARFYIVCEVVALGALKSPLIVCGLSLIHI